MMMFGPILLAGCLAVRAASGWITAGDLAPEFPGLETVASDTALVLAPSPGVARVLHLAELEKIAARLQVEAPRREICIQRAVAPPDPVRMLAAMHAVLPEARVEILDFSRRPIPEGDMEFPLEGLREGPAGCFWSGHVRYAGNHLVPIWARVAVKVTLPRVVAAADLQPGQALTGDLVRHEMRDAFPSAAAFPQSAGQVVGRSARVLIRAGSVIRLDQLEASKEVRIGDTVRVDVWNGSAHLKLDARAEASGTLGQMIPVRNPDSQKRFLARVAGKGRVSVGISREEQDP
jgi:flagella basal body P-ring formation protein FlgA